MSLTNENDVVSQMEKALSELARDRDLLDRLQQEGVSYAREHLTWEAKARAITRILHWVLRQGTKPDLLPPKILRMERAS